MERIARSSSTTRTDSARAGATAAGRAAVIRAYELARTINVKPILADAQAKSVLFGQSQATVR